MRPLRVAVLAAIIGAQGCTSVPITGRKQLNLMPESEMLGMTLTAYQEFLRDNPPLADTDPRAVQVRRIGERLAQAATTYLHEVGAGDRVAGFHWEFRAVNDPLVNAWCMPGGKVVVYTGILPVTQDEAGLAVVMGHEIAHAIARHGNERMSQALAIQGAGMTIELLTASEPGLARDIFLQSYGIGSQLGMLAYSRTHETEADRMGLMFMALAGYDPRSAPGFWQRMAERSEGVPPEFLSTHPSDERRTRDLEVFMEEALKVYRP